MAVGQLTGVSRFYTSLLHRKCVTDNSYEAAVSGKFCNKNNHEKYLPPRQTYNPLIKRLVLYGLS